MTARGFIPVVVLAVLGGGVYYWNESSKATVAAPAKEVSTKDAAAASNHYPIVEAEDETSAAAPGSSARPALPSVDDSDQTIQEGLVRLFSKVQFEALFNSKDIIRRVVVTVDGLTGRLQSPPEFLPLKSAEGAFSATPVDGGYSISPANQGRYTRYVSLVQAMDVKKVTALYKHFYPLFQSAYADLGTKGYFNDRLVEVLDDLLKTPEMPGPVKLVLPSVFYKYSDSALEALPAGQRILLRIGSANAKIVKSKLLELREQLTKK